MNEKVSWVASLPQNEAAVLDGLRLVPGIEMGVVADVVWLRGTTADDALEHALRKIPGLRRFTVLGADRLLAGGHRVPEGRLPAVLWKPLREALPVRLPAAIQQDTISPQLALRIVRSAEEQPANALLTDIGTWRDFAATAAEIRWRSLRFAAARDGRVWVEGLPVPSVAGRRFYVQDGVALPCGFAVSPPVGVAILRRWLGLAPGDVAVASGAGDWEIIKTEQMLPASRSAARFTAEALGV